MVIENKTTKYLYCFYAKYSQEFINMYSRLYNLGAIVGLTLGDKNEDYFNMFDEHIFVVFDKNKVKAFEDYVLFFSLQDYYEIDYPLDERYHVIVFKVHNSYLQTLKNFKQGKYSKMYNLRDLEFLFSASKSFYARFDNITLTTKNCDKVRNLYENFSKLKLSPYHVLRKSDELKEVLSALYLSSANNFFELDSHLDDREYLTKTYQKQLA